MFEDKSPESIKSEILNDLLQDVDKREGSFVSDMVSPMAYALWRMYDGLNSLVPMVYVDETSGEYIDRKCANYGLTRKPGLKAITTMTFSGKDGTVVPAGSTFFTEEGLEFSTSQSVTLAGGSSQAEAVAKEAGSRYNVWADTIQQQLVSIAGLSTISNTKATGGSDRESDKDLVARLYAYLQKPATSGNACHYEQWALEVNGVGGAKVLPLWDGPGTVKILIVGPDKEPASAEVQSLCLAHIEENRPIGAAVTVVSAQALPINIAAQITIDGSTTQGAVQDAFIASMAEWLKEVSFVRYTLLYNRIAFMLLDIPGVVDFQSLTVNGGISNITVGEDEVPVLGTVVVNV